MAYKVTKTGRIIVTTKMVKDGDLVVVTGLGGGWEVLVGKDAISGWNVDVWHLRFADKRYKFSGYFAKARDAANFINHIVKFDVPED